MTSYLKQSKDSLAAQQKQLQQEYDAACAKGLKLDMSRGKPSPAQLALSEGMLTVLKTSAETISQGTDSRNYGCLDGLPEAKTFFAKLWGVKESQMILGGSSSLNIMYDTMMRAMFLGVLGGEKPWANQGKVKFLCPVPGYDRHFGVCEALGIEMINIPMQSDGPDMDMVEALVAKDPMIKGIWSVPKYSNPQGISFSDEVVRRFASMKTAAPDFRIFWDNAYDLHHIVENGDEILNIIDECAKAGNPHRPFMFASTSKITYPGSGVAMIAASEENIAFIKKQLTYQTIGPDKVNELRHIRFFGTPEGVIEHMKKHAAILKPKFDIVTNTLERELDGLEIAQWFKPKGGYFVSLDVYPGTAQRVYELAKQAGVTLTNVGATFPYGKDPEDKNLRISPSFPSEEELQQAMNLLCLCTKLAALEKLLAA